MYLFLFSEYISVTFKILFNAKNINMYEYIKTVSPDNNYK